MKTLQYLQNKKDEERKQIQERLSYKFIDRDIPEDSDFMRGIPKVYFKNKENERRKERLEKLQK